MTLMLYTKLLSGAKRCVRYQKMCSRWLLAWNRPLDIVANCALLCWYLRIFKNILALNVKVHVTLKSAQPICICIMSLIMFQPSFLYSMLLVLSTDHVSPDARVSRLARPGWRGHWRWSRGLGGGSRRGHRHSYHLHPWSQRSSQTGEWLIHEGLVLVVLDIICRALNKPLLQRLKDHNHGLRQLPVYYSVLIVS